MSVPISKGLKMFEDLGQKARLGLQPFTDDAGSPIAIRRPVLREAIVDDFIGLYAERLLKYSGGLFAVIALDRLFEQITHRRHSSSASRLTAGAAGFLILSQWSKRSSTISRCSIRAAE